MTSSPPPTYDLFVSYAHLDNKPLPPDQEGWISQFHETLKKLIEMRLGREVNVWRDNKLDGNDIFDEEISDRLAGTALLVSILTPRYLKSDWCPREVREFCSAAAEHGGIRVDNKSRIFKVIKTPVEDQDSLPPEVTKALGYEFFKYKGDAPLELNPRTTEEEYYEKMAKLAWDAVQLLELLDDGDGDDGGGGTDTDTGDGHAEAKGANRPYAGVAVYLAECTKDMRTWREKVKTELEAFGCSVFPDRVLPTGDEGEYRAAVTEAMASARLAIHLIGTSRGTVPEGPSDESTIELQNEIAAARCRERPGELRRILWLPESESDNDRQRQFLVALTEDPEVQFGADPITGDFEELKTAFHAELEELVRPKRTASAGPSDDNGDGQEARRLYLICVEQDLDAIGPLFEHLDGLGITVDVPVFEGDSAAVREANEEMMKACDGAIIYWGAGDALWKKSIESDLQKAKSLRDGRPLRARFTYVAAPENPRKKLLVRAKDSIDGIAGFAPEQLAALVEALQGTEADS
ncbi:MAG: TIR domain-containing protein [Planctomycetes bacterium]|nr:TIR domain-containing protein [Planctomycetota bacterium]